MIELSSGFPAGVVGVVCKGRVTKSDYDDVLVPAVESALTTHERVRLYYEIAPDFAGIAPGAMWEDFKVGMEHLRRWERIAVVGDVEWIKHAVRLFSFLLPAATRVFPLAQAAQARAWIGGAD